jgi:apolipoprotein D and lipocalin family protein
MYKRMIPALAACLAVLIASAPAVAGPAAAAVQGPPRLELGQMMGRWYEVARLPNSLQRGCQAGASDWTRTTNGFAVVQSCHRGAPDGPLALWKAQAKVADPATNLKFRMSFFGGVLSQDYVVLDHRLDQGWLLLSTANGRYLWLMSQRPTMAAAVRAQAIARIRQLGFDPARLEFPLPPRS